MKRFRAGIARHCLKRESSANHEVCNLQSTHTCRSQKEGYGGEYREADCKASFSSLIYLPPGRTASNPLLIRIGGEDQLLSILVMNESISTI